MQCADPITLTLGASAPSTSPAPAGEVIPRAAPERFCSHVPVCRLACTPCTDNLTPMSNASTQRTTKVVAAPPRREAKPPGPCAMVIFGAGGDLTKRLLVPALYNLSRTGLLPEHFAIVGVDAVDQDADAWSKSLRDMLQSFVGNAASESRIDAVDDAAWQRLTDAMSYMKGDFNDPGLFEKLHAHLHDARSTLQTQGNVLFYLAVADRFFGPIIENLGHAGLFDEELRDEQAQRWRRVVIEKPFGHDLEVRPRAEHPHPPRAARGTDLSDRPFPGQGNRSEHHGVPLRQRLVRADLEPRPHRPCADHRGGNRRRRAPRQVL